MNELEKLVNLSIQFGQMRVLVNREPTHWHVHEFLRLAGEMNEQKKSLTATMANDKSANNYVYQQTNYTTKEYEAEWQRYMN